jgi:hypothetical protein
MACLACLVSGADDDARKPLLSRSAFRTIPVLLPALLLLPRPQEGPGLEHARRGQRKAAAAARTDHLDLDGWDGRPSLRQRLRCVWGSGGGETKRRRASTAMGLEARTTITVIITVEVSRPASHPPLGQGYGLTESRQRTIGRSKDTEYSSYARLEEVWIAAGMMNKKKTL